MQDIFVPDAGVSVTYGSLSDTQDFGYQEEIKDSLPAVLNVLRNDYSDYRLPTDDDTLAGVIELLRSKDNEFTLIERDDFRLYLHAMTWRSPTSYLYDPKDYDVYWCCLIVSGEAAGCSDSVDVCQITADSTIYSNAEISADIAEEFAVNAYLELANEFDQDYGYICESYSSYVYE